MKQFLSQEDYQTAYDAALNELELFLQGMPKVDVHSIHQESWRRLATRIVDAVARSDIPVSGDITDIPGVKVQRDE